MPRTNPPLHRCCILRPFKLWAMRPPDRWAISQEIPMGVMLQVSRCPLIAPRAMEATMVSNAMPFERTTRAERAVPFSAEFRCSPVADRAKDHMHPVRQFALCIWQAPRLAATFGSFWSRQKELAEGREFGEMWMLNNVSTQEIRNKRFVARMRLPCAHGGIWVEISTSDYRFPVLPKNCGWGRQSAVVPGSQPPDGC